VEAEELQTQRHLEEQVAQERLAFMQVVVLEELRILIQQEEQVMAAVLQCTTQVNLVVQAVLQTFKTFLLLMEEMVDKADQVVVTVMLEVHQEQL
jgi:hypothetical protein